MTPDEATQNLARAIADHAVATGQANADEEMLNDFIVIANWQAIANQPAEDTYSIAMHSDNAPFHVLAGLLRVGERFLVDAEGGEL